MSKSLKGRQVAEIIMHDLSREEASVLMYVVENRGSASRISDILSRHGSPVSATTVKEFRANIDAHTEVSPWLANYREGGKYAYTA